MAKRTTDGQSEQPKSALEEVLRDGAKALIGQAVEAELAELLARYENVRLLDGRRAVVRNGFLPERQVLTAAGNIVVRIPKVRDRSGKRVKFNSNLVPPYVRRSARVSAALPWLYLKGISTGDMHDALVVLLGEEAKGLSPNVISRLKATWADEYDAWAARSLAGKHYVYWWADGVHTNLRGESIDHQCLLTIVGVRPDGAKELVALADGIRESKASWGELLLGLKERGLKEGPLLATGDGAMGFWAALAEVYPATRQQRCWVHKMANVLNALPKALQPKARGELQQIWMADTREAAGTAFDRFIKTYQAKYPKATDKLSKDREPLLAFYEFPAEHWVHLRTSNPIESTFATVRHRTTRAKGCVSRSSFLGLAFKLVGEAERSWRRINAPERIADLLAGTVFKDGEPAKPDQQQEQQRLVA